MSHVNFIASVDKNYLPKMDEIVRELQKWGFSVEKVRRLTGTISGSTDSVASIRRTNIPGVIIEPEKTYYTQ